MISNRAAKTKTQTLKCRLPKPILQHPAAKHGLAYRLHTASMARFIRAAQEILCAMEERWLEHLLASDVG
jgi:hypothetical protein